jgi:hypothetical protein
MIFHGENGRFPNHPEVDRWDLSLTNSATNTGDEKKNRSGVDIAYG